MIDTEQFDEARKEWEFQKLAKEHSRCCVGALEFNGHWINIIAGGDPRRWDESLRDYLVRTT